MSKHVDPPFSQDCGERLLDVETVALRLRVSGKKVRRGFAKGALPAHKLGHLIRVTETDLVAYLAARRVAFERRGQ